MLAVLASRFDAQAVALVEAWSDHGAALCSAEDLCAPGWAFSVAQPAAGTAVIGGARADVRDLRAVLTRRPAVVAEELDFVEPDDREYAAAEINAFLVAWLSSLPCPVLNRPTPRSLSGPSWKTVQWQIAAARAGIEWAHDAADADADVVVVCGDRTVGARDPRDARAAQALAQIAGVELLGARIADGRVCAVSTNPDLSNPEVRDVVLAYLEQSA
ncbi:MAG: hypothetical protein JWL83_1290 [Actinomycetia bacterium]|nr:hypothetical protein [Actinomycetes bacterium]